MLDSCEVPMNGHDLRIEFNWKMIVSTADKGKCVVCGTRSETENTFTLQIELIRVINTETEAEMPLKQKSIKKILKAMSQTEADKPHCEQCLKKRKFNSGFTMSHVWKAAWDDYCQAP